MNRTRLALVHHANQSLLTEGYENREGLARIVQGYASVLQAHAQFSVPCSLHLSGILIEAIAWGCPWFFQLVNGLRRQGVVRMMGGTYAENIMPLTDDTCNQRQLVEFLDVFERHLGGAQNLEWFWVPERVWNTNAIAPLITESSLINGGYKGVLLDRRLLQPTHPKYKKFCRADGDALGPWADPERRPLGVRLEKLSAQERQSWLASLDMRQLANSGLLVAPISEHLRYWIPFRNDGDRELITELARMRTSSDPLVFADDLERMAGVAGWDATGFRRYRDFLSWLQQHTSLEPAPLQLNHQAPTLDTIDSGTFFEFETKLGGGVDGRGFLLSDDAKEAEAHFSMSRAALESAQDSDERLLALGWKHLLASQYETFWHDSVGRMAPWARALASHSRHACVIAEAARWFTQATPIQATVELRDLDGDGEEEVILKNRSLFVVLSPCSGGRIVALFHHAASGGAMMIGNPTDDWNFQSELNSFMHIPPNHPGAFCETNGENDVCDIEFLTPAQGVGVGLTRRDPESLWRNVRKTFSIDDEESKIRIKYVFAGPDHGPIVVSLSPDYLSLLKDGGKEAVVEIHPERFSASYGLREIQVTLKYATFRPAGKIGHGWKAEINSQQEMFQAEVTCRTL